MNERLIIIGLLIIAIISLFIDSSITVAVVSGLIGYLVPKHNKHIDEENN